MTSLPSPSWPVVRRFDADHLHRVSLPVGGIGTGTIGFGGRGDLRDVEIANRPAKGFVPDIASLIVRVAGADRAPALKVLEGPLDPSEYEGSSGSPAHNHGLPRFRQAEYLTAYPFGRVQLTDPHFPVAAAVEAWNPFIPVDVESSSLPLAVFDVTLVNVTDEELSVSLAFNLRNTLGAMRRGAEAPVGHNTLIEGAGYAGVHLQPGEGGLPEDTGDIAIAVVDGQDVSRRTNWAELTWGGPALDFADDLLDDGALDERPAGVRRPVGSVCERRTLQAGETTTVRLLMSWRFPDRGSWADAEPTVTNHYTTLFDDSASVLSAVVPRLEDLRVRTEEFVKAYWGSDLPDVVKEAALANVSTLRTQTCFRTDDGRFFGWEGCNDDVGCCSGSCTHVWNYEQATPFLFGELARSMREVELEQATTDSGFMSFRVGLPLADSAQEWQVAAADGQMGCIIKLYREWRLSGDDAFLRRHWPRARAALEFCWVPGGWDADVDGVMEGVQHNTMDVEYHGPNPQMEVWYLAALRSAAAMATYVGDDSFASKCTDLADRGRDWTEANLFNGDYYEHKVQTSDHAAPGLAISGLTPALQLGAGCLIDQLVGQFLAHVAGLGHLLDKEQMTTALRSVVKFNRREGFFDHNNVMRSYVLGDETAVLMASYPHGERPKEPFSYFTEVMTGFEYTLAAGLAYEGDIDEALRVVADIRERYDGRRRNPYDEAECGHHYARAMASWGMLLALSTFHYDGVDQTMTIASGSQFFSTGDAWGTVATEGSEATLRVLGGELTLSALTIPGVGSARLESKALAMGDSLELSLS